MLCDNSWLRSPIPFHQTHVFNLTVCKMRHISEQRSQKPVLVVILKFTASPRYLEKKKLLLQPAAILLNGKLCSLCLVLFTSFPDVG
jgi:hypothetical protein